MIWIIPFSGAAVGPWAGDSFMHTLRLRLLTLATLVALVAFPLAARAAACCDSSRMSCCPAGSPCSEPPSSPDCQSELAACVPALEAPAAIPAGEVDALVAAPLLEEVLAEACPPTPAVVLDVPRPRSSLLEGGACLHTTLLPPLARPR